MIKQGTAATALEEMWHARCPVPTPSSVAVQLGWVERVLCQAGVSLRSIPEIADPERHEQYYESTLPNSFRHGGSVPAICARSNGLATRVVGLSWTDEYQAVIALPQTGLTRVKELRGRRIGIPLHDTPIDHGRAAALRGFSATLAVEGLTLRDVEVVDLPDHQIPSVTRNGAVISTGSGRRGRNRYTSEVRALARGDVDAVYVKDTSGAQATHLLGAVVIGNIGFHPDPWVRINNCTPRPLTVSQFLLDHHPEIVRALLEQAVLAGEWAAQHAAQTLTLIARETGSSETWVRYAYGERVHEQLRLSLDPAWIAGLGTFTEFLATHGFIDGPLDVSQWIDPAPLRDVLEGQRRSPTRKGRRPTSAAPQTRPPVYH